MGLFNICGLKIYLLGKAHLRFKGNFSVGKRGKSRNFSVEVKAGMT